MTDAPQPTPVRYQVNGDLTLVADHWGSPEGAPVLFLHGGGQTRHSWGGTATTLAKRGRYAVTMDMRGHGESDWEPSGYYQLDGYASDLSEVAANFEQKPILVGASLGGLTAILLEGHVAPGTLGALVLVDIVPRMNADGAERVLEFMSSKVAEGFATLDEVADAVSSYNPHRPRPSDLEGLKKNLRERDGRWYWHWDPKTIPNTHDGYRRNNPDRPLSQVRDVELLSRAMASIEIPVLLIRGRMSDLVTEEGAQDFLAEYPNAKFADVSGAGHMVAGDRNDVFTDAVLGFIDQLD